MPRPDPTRPSRPSFSLSIYLSQPPRKPPRRRKGGEGEREPVAPDQPRPLAGGAAAALEYDD
jgi:hypothetical protein